MTELLLFFVAAIVLIGGTLALFRFFTPREATHEKSRSVSSSPAPPSPTTLSPTPDINARWEEFGRAWRSRQNQGEEKAASAPDSVRARELVNAPLLIVVGSLSLIALVWLLTNLPIQASVTLVEIALAIAVAVMFSPRRIREGQQQQRGMSERVPAPGNVSFSDAGALQPIGIQTGLSAEAQAARQPAQSPRQRAAPARTGAAIEAD